MLWWFPGLLAAAVAVLTALNLNGSSTGAFYQAFHRSSSDPDVLLGQVRPIRTDEWLVQSGWVVSQVAQGFPRRNDVFPGGMDATLMNDLPTWDWSSAFRPHTWGFLALGLDHGMAVRWWLPTALMLAAAYFFIVTMLPRRPLVGAVVALALLFQPEVQWWWLPILPNPVAFAFMAMAAVVWGLRCSGRWGRILPAIAAGYLAVDMAMGIYVPFMIPAILAVAAFAVGFTLREARSRALTLRDVARGLMPLALSAVGAALVVGAWLGTRRDAVHALSSTVYPGRRVTAPGSQGEQDFASLVSAPFQRWLQFHSAPSAIGPNQSEASSAILVSLYLLVPLGWVVWAQWRRRRLLDWTVLAIVAVQAVVLAFLYLPGWERIAALTGLDLAMPQRLRLLFVILGVVAFVLLVDRLDDLDVAAPWVVAAATGVVVLVLGAWTWRHLDRASDGFSPPVSALVVLALLSVAVAAVARRQVLVGGTLLLLCALIVGAGVNPLNRGVFDLRTQTSAGRAIAEIHQRDPDARWLAIGSQLTGTTLVESGVSAYNGVQTYPAQPMWDQIDPSHAYEPFWNRLANITWVAGSGDPDPRQPAGAQDQIQLTFDSCASFAQQYVGYVISDSGGVHQDCLQLMKRFHEGRVKQWLYRVTPAQGGSRPGS